MPKTDPPPAPPKDFRRRRPPEIKIRYIQRSGPRQQAYERQLYGWLSRIGARLELVWRFGGSAVIGGLCAGFLVTIFAGIRNPSQELLFSWWGVAAGVAGFVLILVFYVAGEILKARDDAEAAAEAARLFPGE